MRFLYEITIPAPAGNAAIKNGMLFHQMKKIFEDLKPEAVYFGIKGGQRTMFMVIDIPSGDKLPWTTEPFWLDWNADVTMTMVMNQADMEKAGKDFEKILMSRK